MSSRSESRPCVPGDTSKIAVTFDTELNDPSLTLVEWQDNRFVPFVPPAPGKSVIWTWSPGADGTVLSSGIFSGPMHEPGSEGSKGRTYGCAHQHVAQVVPVCCDPQIAGQER